MLTETFMLLFIFLIACLMLTAGTLVCIS